MMGLRESRSVPVGSDVDIVLMRGPLSDEWLHHIARLYGSHDPKYGVDFCRYQFNDNPFGFSLHAFARAGEDVVGHFAVIPVATRVHGATRITGKAESLFVHKEFRKFHVDHGDGRDTLAVAMVRLLYQFGDEQGFSVIHSLGRQEFARIHAAGGARVLEFPRRQLAFFFGLDAVRKLLGDSVTPHTAGQILEHQRKCYGEAKSRTTVVQAQSREIASSELDVPAFMEVAVPDDRWTVSPTRQTAQWYLGSQAVRRMRASGDGAYVDFVYSAPGSGSWFEVFDWRCPLESSTLALWALCQMIDAAEQEGRELVCFFDWTEYNPAADVLQRAAESLGFEAVEKSRLIYVRSAEPGFSTAEQLAFSPYFYCTF